MNKILVKRASLILAVALPLLLAMAAVMPATAQVAPSGPPGVYYLSSNGKTVTQPLGSTFYVILPSSKAYLGRFYTSTGLKYTYAVAQGPTNLWEIKATAKGNQVFRAMYLISPTTTSIFQLNVKVV